MTDTLSKLIICNNLWYYSNQNWIHSSRVVGLIDKSKVVLGGDHDASQRYIEPTILFNVTPDDKIMQEEIFGWYFFILNFIHYQIQSILILGPVLPFVTVKNYEEAIEFINER